jgi:hypothetical protein
MALDLPPQDIAAEQAVLGAILLSQDALEECRDLLSQDEFYRPAHGKIWATALALRDSGEPADAVTVAAALVERNQLAMVGGYPYLHTLIDMVPTAANATYYAEIVAEKSVLRGLIKAGTRIVQMAHGVNRGETGDGSVADVLDRAEAELKIATRLTAKGHTLDGLSTWLDFIARFGGTKRTWVVPQLISEQDVWMILAPPGAGKTTLSRQICWCVAAGLHPFNQSEKIPPQTTLLVDLENDPATAAEESSGPLNQVRRLGDLDEGRAWIWTRVDGVNLRTPAEARLFEQAIAEVKPKLVAFGSLYKAGVQARGGESHEVAANEVREVFDKLRRRYGFALWLEHHMPKDPTGGRKRSPFGSSVWEWWPSHGRILEKAVNSPTSPYRFAANDFRADRGVRHVPAGFSRGGRLPWSAIWDLSQLSTEIEEAESTRG